MMGAFLWFRFRAVKALFLACSSFLTVGTNPTYTANQSVDIISFSTQSRGSQGGVQVPTGGNPLFSSQY